MANYDDEGPGYRYHFWSSTSNLFFENNDGLPCFMYWHQIGNLSLRLPPLDIMTTVCSSSRGLIACRDPFFNYYIGNPLAEGRNAYISLPPSPRTHTSDDTSVVLATDILGNDEPIAFHLICAVRVKANTYTFDTYSSILGDWLSTEPQALRAEICRNTGVSCGRMAYWLIEQAGVLAEVVEFDALSKLIRYLGLPCTYKILVESSSELQLGRVRNMLGLVMVRKRPKPRVELHVHGENRWRRFDSLGIDIQADTETLDWVGQNIAREFLQRTTTVGPLLAGTIVTREMPRPLRFESSKMEVLLWVDGWLIVWEMSGINGSLVTQVVLCPVTGGTPARFANAIPHVCTTWLPDKFFFNLPASPATGSAASNPIQVLD